MAIAPFVTGRGPSCGNGKWAVQTLKEWLEGHFAPDLANPATHSGSRGIWAVFLITKWEDELNETRRDEMGFC